MTYAELKTEIANYLNRTDLTNQLDGTTTQSVINPET